jgi:flagellin-like hook-associated protein FlgL
MPAALTPNPAHVPGDPSTPGLFDGSGPVTIQIYDSNYHDPNLPIPDNHPTAQRMIPGSVQLGGNLMEKPNKNENLNPPSPDYEIDYVKGTITLLSSDAKAAFYNNATGTLNPPDQMPEMGFDYVYRNSIDMSGEIYRETDSGIKMQINANPDDIFGKGGLSDTDSFKEIISLMQGLWTNEQTEIAEGIDTIDSARQRNLAQQAVEGARLNRVGISYERNLDLAITNTKGQSQIEDVDLASAMSEWAMADAVYNSSLKAAAQLMNRSLMDYI